MTEIPTIKALKLPGGVTGVGPDGRLMTTAQCRRMWAVYMWGFTLGGKYPV